MPDDTPTPLDVIAKAQGFPLAGQGAVAPTGVPIPKTALAPGPVAAFKAGPSAGTTELVPGATDWIKQLFVDMLPVRSANASAAPMTATNAVPAGMPPAPQTNNLARVSGAPNPNVMGPPAPQPSFFSRFVRGLVGPEEPQPLGPGGVRG